MAGDPYARVSLKTGRWPPLVACSVAARWAWVSMWTSLEMKNACAGLFFGSVNTVAEAASLSFAEAVSALDELVDHGLVQHDPIHRLTRYLKLPDRFDRPDNGNCLKGWWRGFVLLPPCDTRDAHVDLVRWLCGETLSKDHETVWSTTFGTIPPKRTISSTSSMVSQVPVVSSSQADLFDSADLGNHGGMVPGTIRISISQSKSLREGEHERERYPQAPLLPLAEGTNPGVTAPALNARSMLNAIAGAAGGRVAFDLIDQRLLPDIESVAQQCSAAGVRFDDLDLAGRFLRAGGLAYRKDLGASWAARPGNVLDLVSNARLWNKGELRLENGEDDDGPTEPRPISAFTTGRRQL